MPLPTGLAAVGILRPAPWLELAVGAVDADNRSGLVGFETASDDPWLHVTPDFQWIADPGARSGRRNAVVLVLRTRVGF